MCKFLKWILFFLLLLSATIKVPATAIAFYSNDPLLENKQVDKSIDSLAYAHKLFYDNQQQQALELCLRLLKKAEKNKDSIQIERIKFQIANFFINTNNYKKALDYLIESYAIASVSNIDSLHLIDTQLLLGTVYFKTNQLDSAKTYLKKVISTYDKTGKNASLYARAFGNLSAVNVLQNDLIEAEINALEALYILKNSTNYFGIANAQNNLATIYLEQERYRDAKRELLEALYLLRNDNSKKVLALKEIIYDNISWALYQLKDYRTYEYQEKSFHIRDSLRNAEIGGYLAKIEGKFNEETIKKREELKTAQEKTKRLKTQGYNNILVIISISLILGTWLILRYTRLRQQNLNLEFKQNQLIQQSKIEQLQSESREKILNATLDGKESERKMIAETLHHSVSSMLSSASLHLQASRMHYKDVPPAEIEKAQGIINEAAEKIRNLSHSLVSSVLLKFGLAYSVQDLCDKYSNAALNFHCNCESISRYKTDFELKINSIIDELLNNIIKHSKAENAEIKMKQEENLLIIRILDDGQGFDPDKIYDKDGLGLNQIEARIKKMQGDFHIISSKNEGTSIHISVPIQFKE